VWSAAHTAWENAVRSVATARSDDDVHMRIKRLWLRRGNRPILVTGQPGAGKTALYGALTGKVGLGYHTGPSSGAEPHRALFKTPERRHRVALVIVPGQESEERERTLDATLRRGNAP
jgi:hypothetical protein